MEDRFNFRCWDKKDKRFLNHLSFDISPNGILVINTPLEGKKYITITNDRYILTQSTGLHDKNGKPIYEGDIINIQCKNLTKNQLSDVFYCKERAGFCFNYETDYGDIVPCSMNKCIVEVIGNIWQDKGSY